MSAWKLVSGGGQTVRRGKSDYHPDFVRVELRKQDVVDVLREVSARWDDREEVSTPIELRVLGQLTPDFTEEKDPVRAALENALESVEMLARMANDTGDARLAQTSAIALSGLRQGYRARWRAARRAERRRARAAISAVLDPATPESS